MKTITKTATASQKVRKLLDIGKSRDVYFPEREPSEQNQLTTTAQLCVQAMAAVVGRHDAEANDLQRRVEDLLDLAIETAETYTPPIKREFCRNLHDDSELYRNSLHEGAHAVAAAILRMRVLSAVVTEPGHGKVTTKGIIVSHEDMMYTAAGWAAETKYFGSASGCTDDFTKIRDLGIKVRTDDGNGRLYSYTETSAGRQLREETEDLLRDHWQLVEEIAVLLYETSPTPIPGNLIHRRFDDYNNARGLPERTPRI